MLLFDKNIIDDFHVNDVYVDDDNRTLYYNDDFVLTIRVFTSKVLVIVDSKNRRKHHIHDRSIKVLDLYNINYLDVKSFIEDTLNMWGIR